jgi:signal transduction histidine kinase
MVNNWEKMLATIPKGVMIYNVKAHKVQFANKNVLSIFESESETQLMEMMKSFRTKSSIISSLV